MATPVDTENSPDARGRYGLFTCTVTGKVAVTVTGTVSHSHRHSQSQSQSWSQSQSQPQLKPQSHSQSQTQVGPLSHLVMPIVNYLPPLSGPTLSLSV